MGAKWEVSEWVNPYGVGYGYRQVYYGASLIRALRAARRAKRTAGCVKVEWR